MRNREHRRNIMLRAQLRSETGSSDVLVRNISPRGLLVSTNPSLKRGAYIEIRRDRQTIVARVMWAAGSFAGLRTQDPIDVDRLLAVTPNKAKGADKAGLDSRSSTPGTQQRGPAKWIEHARIVSSRLQFGVLAATLAIAALLVAWAVNDQLAAPLHKVRTALGGRG
jgi:hypothetical protein